MSVLAVITLTCDGCGNTLAIEAASLRAARRHSITTGWHQHRRKTPRRNLTIDLCPTCPNPGHERPHCSTCGITLRPDHRCPGPPVATPRPASTRRLPKLRHV